jgi:tetratricopeptide (TPR) repeat protein
MTHLAPSAAKSAPFAAVFAAGLFLLCIAATPVWASGDDDAPKDTKSADYKAGVKAIWAQDYQTGMDLMTKVLAATPNDADAFNWIGYAQRKQGHYAEALTNYQKALALNPKHLGAHEYMGEAYLEMNQLDDAKKELAALDHLCMLSCTEYSTLKKAVADYEKKKA